MGEPRPVVVASPVGGRRWVVDLRRGSARTTLAIFDGYAAARRAAAYKRRVESVLEGHDPEDRRARGEEDPPGRSALASTMPAAMGLAGTAFSG